MLTKVYIHAKKSVIDTSKSIRRQNINPQRATHPTPYDHILHLQRSAGNRACRRPKRFLPSTSGKCPDIIHSDVLFLAKSPDSLPGFILEIGSDASGSIQRSTLKRYKRSRSALKRKLAAITRITSPSRKKRKQIKLLKTIYNKIIGNNPFSSIQVKKISDWAETEWINPARKNLGIKVVFSEDIFKETLEKIIATAIHEATHASQLKSGMEYYPHPQTRVGIRQKYYLETVRHLAEADANLETLTKFEQALGSKQATFISKIIAYHFLKADQCLSTIASTIYLRPLYRRKLERLFTQNKLKNAKEIQRLWKKNKGRLRLKHDLFPWRKLP